MSFIKRAGRMIIVAKALVGLTFAGGVILVVLSLPGMVWASATPSLLQPVLQLIAVALTATVALSITRDWRGQRADAIKEQKRAAEQTLQAEQREQRASAYARAISGIVQTFAGGSQGDLAVDRATIALWGSPNTVAAVDEWQKAAYEIMQVHAGRVPPERRQEIQLLVAKVAVEARADLGLGEDLDIDAIAALLFDDYRK